MIYQFETLKNKNCNNFTSNNKINVYHFSLNTYNSRKLRQTIREMIIVSQSSWWAAAASGAYVIDGEVSQPENTNGKGTRIRTGMGLSLHNFYIKGQMKTSCYMLKSHRN